MVCTQNWMRSSAWEILFITIQVSCTDPASGEGATKKFHGWLWCHHNGKVPSGVSASPQGLHRVPRTGQCLWQARAAPRKRGHPFWIKIPVFPYAQIITNAHKGWEIKKPTSHWKRFYSSSKVLQWHIKRGGGSVLLCSGKPHSFSFNISCNSRSTSFHWEVNALEVCEQRKGVPKNLIKSILQQEAVCWVRRDLFPMLLQAYLSSWEEPY